jgi:Domain of unknown function (DUF4145)
MKASIMRHLLTETHGSLKRRTKASVMASTISVSNAIARFGMSPASPFNEFGYKRLTLENWLTVDPAWSGVVMSSSQPNPSEAWVYDLIQIELDPVVPLSIRKLFEIARGTLVYSLMFYPLLSIGTEQMFRVFDAAVSAKCKEMKAPSKVQRFADRIKWLGEHTVILPEQQSRWTAIRHLRNEASHPTDQSILPPTEALMILDIAVELINPLFAMPTPANP